MEYSIGERKAFHSFALLFILFVLMIVMGLIITPAIIRLSLPWLFGIGDAAGFMTTPAEQLKYPMALMYDLAFSSSIGFFILPVVLYHMIFRFDMVSAMGMRVLPRARYWLLAIGIMFLAGIFIQWLVQITMSIPLPPRLQALRTNQEEIDRIINALFRDTGLLRFLLLTLVLGLLPAVAEELCFRGTIQQTLESTNLGPGGAIIMTGLVFSLAHAEFDNFFAIWCMGIVLGCLYYYSGSIWVSISAHFFNNFLMIAGKFAFLRGLLHSDPSGNEFLPVYLTISAGVLMVAGLMVMRKWSGKYSAGMIN